MNIETDSSPACFQSPMAFTTRHRTVGAKDTHVTKRSNWKRNKALYSCVTFQSSVLCCILHFIHSFVTRCQWWAVSVARAAPRHILRSSVSPVCLLRMYHEDGWLGSPHLISCLLGRCFQKIWSHNIERVKLKCNPTSSTDIQFE